MGSELIASLCIFTFALIVYRIGHLAGYNSGCEAMARRVDELVEPDTYQIDSHGFTAAWDRVLSVDELQRLHYTLSSDPDLHALSPNHRWTIAVVRCLERRDDRESSYKEHQ